MSVELPTLSASGWVMNTPEKLDRLVSYFIVSEASQSHLFAGQVASLPSIIQKNAENESGLVRDTTDALNSLLSRYFDSAEVSVDTAHPVADDPNRINLRVDAVVIDNGQRYSVGREITLVNSKVINIFNINNG